MKKVALLVSFLLLLTSCQSVTPAPISTEKIAPTVTSSPTSITTFTPEPTETAVPSLTPIPITYVTLGSPFASDCGDGIPRIWGNDAFNFTWYPNCNDDHHGHVDWNVPSGCDVNSYTGDVVSPVNGYLSPYNDDKGKPLGVHIILDNNEYPLGVLDALRFAGVDNPSLKNITEVNIDFGHIKLTTSGHVNKGQTIAEIVPAISPNGMQVFYKLGYKVNVEYTGYGGIPFSPTLFPNELPDGTLLQPMLDGTSTNWICVPGSYYDCVPEAKDYAPTCKFGQ